MIVVLAILIICCFISVWIEEWNGSTSSKQNKRIEKIEKEIEELKRK